VSDGSPLAVALIVGPGSRVDRHRHQGSTPVKGIHRVREHGADATHGDAHLAVVTLP
jgi:hypothetical protein